MQFGRLYVDRRMVIAAGSILAFAATVLLPWSRPDDAPIVLHVDPAINSVQRTVVGPLARQRKPWGRRGYAFNPRSVGLSSEDANFDVYVVELSGDSEASVAKFLDVSERIAGGETVPQEEVFARRLDVHETSIDLTWLPGLSSGRYLLIIHGDAPAEIDGFVSYGGSHDD